MVTVIRKSMPTVLESRREIIHAVSWQVRTNIWSPPTDIIETEEFYLVRVELAGMRDANFEVAVDQNILYISGQRSDLAGRKAYHQMEIRFGKFFTAITLPGLVDIDEAHAEYDDGFLTIKLPKLRPSQIKVE